ncbi:hypothetical protein PUMCH_002407 [Australozyma saopauloensis]|uniref:Calcineurin-like phosphoesterase domain-containing protein n=1 Tax=Australozyma saopauloensis TaxID=291208 RepID=A0AAX4H9X7_9ASCO|nr:hypothetical protein PUMCH_002407 [[Candida] saopauloensis]
MSEGLRERKKVFLTHVDNDHNSGDQQLVGKRAASPRLFRILVVVPVLAIVALWIVTFNYFERVRVKNALNACSWETWEGWEGEQANTRPHRLAILADPQLVDDHTYPHLPKIIDKILRKLGDNYLHYNYKYLQSELQPDSTLFIGDLFDGGRDWDDQPWIEEFERFNRIFPQYAGHRSFRGLPGNHDIGFQNISVATRKRFAAHFGELNDFYVLGNHTFLQFDTISYSHEDPEVHTESREYVEAIKSAIDPLLPKIMLTHVPLFRDPKVETCGPGRESQKLFPLMRGVQYQTVIDYWVTDKLLHEFDPLIVFSGDDHDYCDMTHLDYDDQSKYLAREISCKTPSMTNGIRFPAYQLLSLNNPVLNEAGTNAFEKTYETKMCYLPTPYVNVKVYAFGYIATCILWWLLVFRSASGTQSVSPGASRKPADYISFSFQCIVILGFILYLLSLYVDM